MFKLHENWDFLFVSFEICALKSFGNISESVSQGDKMFINTQLNLGNILVCFSTFHCIKNVFTVFCSLYKKWILRYNPGTC